MSESIDYAEMLEIPVNTLNVVKKKGRKKKDDDLKNRVVQEVNERMQEEAQSVPAGEGQAPVFSEGGEPLSNERVAGSEDVTDYVSDAAEKPKKKFFDSRVLIAEFAAVCALVALILLTNIFMPNSAINTFFAGLTDTEETVYEDDRVYSELTLGSVVSDDIECTVTDGVLTFTGECSVYAPYGGTVQSVSETDGVYTVEIEHTTSFTSVITGLSSAYWAAGDTVYSTIPVGYSDGAGEVSVRLYDAGSLISSYSVNEENDIVWNV